MTPDHLHGILSIAAMKRNKHVIVHKPLSNRLIEGKKAIEMAKKSNVITHLVPWDFNGSMAPIMEWINAGAIGTLREVHNWTNRPVWPQYPEKPTDTPPVPEGFDWDLWLGPEAERPYHPHYTHMTFRGWYDFGGGAMADMGHYSLWSVFKALNLTSPTVVEPSRSHVCSFNDAVPYRINNDFAFPMASMVRFRYPAVGNRAPIELCWYDGSMRPQTPEELFAVDKQLPQEGMMFVGDKGKILSGFNLQEPKLLVGGKTEASKSKDLERGEMLKEFVAAVKSGKQYEGSFREAEYITEAINLYAVALRTNKLLKYDAANVKITNVPEANKYLDREYRRGWEPSTI